MPSAPLEGEPVPADGSLPAAALAGVGQRPFSLYLHVPFCASRCGYCDFNTYTAAELGSAPGTAQQNYLAAVVAEFDLAQRVLPVSPEVNTVFFGGGTPTLLPAGELVGLLQQATRRFPLAEGAEVTTEANPESVDAAYLSELREGGFTRLSLGMQSARPSVLATLERRHSPGRAIQVVEWARAAGFESVSLDLIYGTPGETLADWNASLAVAISANVDHISAYSLIVEPGTRLAARIRRGDLADIDPDVQAQFYEAADTTFLQAGLNWYEVSNWAIPGKECRHNLAYWQGHDWWGFGPGSHSHVGGVRWWNRRHPFRYADKLSHGCTPAEAREVLTSAETHMERIMLALRLRSGLPLVDLSASARQLVPQIVAQGWAELNESQLVLTLSGRLVADRIAAMLTD